MGDGGGIDLCYKINFIMTLTNLAKFISVRLFLIEKINTIKRDKIR